MAHTRVFLAGLYCCRGLHLDIAKRPKSQWATELRARTEDIPLNFCTAVYFEGNLVSEKVPRALSGLGCDEVEGPSAFCRGNKHPIRP